MKKITILPLCFFALSFSAFSQPRQTGTNLSGLQYYTPQIVFKDAFKQCATWMTRNATSTAPWNTNATIPMLSDGYPTQVPFGSPAQYVHTLMFFEAGGTYPSGSYTILSDGVGTIQMEWDCGNQTFTSPCNIPFNVNATNTGMHLTITYSDVNNPIRNIRIIMPGFINNYLSNPYYPAFVNYTDSASAFFGLRYMDFMKINFSPVVTWSQRTTKDYYTQTTDNGVAYEYMTDIANRLDKDIWVCIPHQADDNFIQNFATLLHDSLETDRKIYLEYTNEAWNSMFSQTPYCNAQGAALGYSGPAWEQGWKFYAKRSADVHRIFETVFGVNSPRLKKVVATQAGNSWVGNEIMTYYNNITYNPTGVTANALAIAPYFGGNIADSIGDAGAISSITVEQIVSSMHASVFSQTQVFTAAYNIIAANHNVDLIAYEGGQHLVAVNQTYVNDTTLTNKLIAANRHPSMQNIYCDMFDVWFNNGGQEFFVYSSIRKPSKHGSWGVLEYADQPLASSYKWNAINQCGNDTAMTTGISVSSAVFENVIIYPNPFSTQTTLQTDNLFKSATLTVYNCFGQTVKEIKNISGQTVTLFRDNLPSGLYFVRLTQDNKIITTDKLVITD